MRRLTPMVLLAVALAGCKQPTPLEEFLERAEDPEWCPTSWDEGVYKAWVEAECRWAVECGTMPGPIEDCAKDAEDAETPSWCIRGCDLRDCVEWMAAQAEECTDEQKPDVCRSATWCE